MGERAKTQNLVEIRKSRVSFLYPEVSRSGPQAPDNIIQKLRQELLLTQRNFEVIFISDLMSDFEYLDDYDDEVWDENRWEEFMQEQDRKTDEYLKKLEEDRLNGTNIHPLIEPKEDLQGNGDLDLESETELSDLEPEAWESPRMYWEEGDFEDIPVYQIAFDFSLAVYDFVERFYPEGTDIPEIKELLQNSLIIPAKIAGGHGMGYEKDGVC